MQRYGVKFNLQIPGMATKVAIQQTRSQQVLHWKTRRYVVCVGSYEVAVVTHLNHLRINYEWQPRAFPMPNGRTYRPDLYLPDLDLWIEIKGYFRKDAQAKWTWFHDAYPNSQLWTGKVLRDMGLPVKL
jgi:hypothetical protein